MNLLGLRAAFFDIGGTLGVVTPVDGAMRLQVYPTSHALLGMLSGTLGLRIGIISNIPNEMSAAGLHAMLAASGLLDVIDGNAVITNHDAGINKPDWRIFTYAANHIGVPPDQCLYVGEDPLEVAGARAAGMSGLIKPSPT